MGHLIQQESINETTVSVIESRNEMEPGYKGWSPFMDERNRATRACVKTIVIFFIKYRKFLKSVGQEGLGPSQYYPTQPLCKFIF